MHQLVRRLVGRDKPLGQRRQHVLQGLGQPLQRMEAVRGEAVATLLLHHARSHHARAQEHLRAQRSAG